jgi:hypothetical protein
MVRKVVTLYRRKLSGHVPTAVKYRLLLDQRSGSRSLEWIAKQIDAYEGQFLLRHDPYELRQACVPDDDFVWALDSRMTGVPWLKGYVACS